MLKKISGWGKYPKIYSNMVAPKSFNSLMEILLSKPNSFIARGNGRSYGDAAINKELTIKMTNLNKIESFNVNSGEVIAESGVLISDLINRCLPQGWFPFVVAGTKFITLGGAIACDVHGKNHHNDGSFGKYVKWIEIIDEDNKILRCSKNENKKLFEWTIGGMGFTGIITKCCIQLMKIETSWINKNTIKNRNLNETLNSFDQYQSHHYSVAWIDCGAKGKNFGRSILFTGSHATYSDIGKKRPLKLISNKLISLNFNPPSFLINQLTVSLFNKIYFLMHKSKRNYLINYEKYFFPLDSINGWNNIYGKKGFFQFQCVIPTKSSTKALNEILHTIQKFNSNSFLSVLKKFGNGNGQLSFPVQGYTISLDFKMSNKNISLANKLHSIVEKYSGRVYLAKDALHNHDRFFSEKIREMKAKGIKMPAANSELLKRKNI